MCNRWSSKMTADVNTSIAKGRRPTGKGTRRTTYQNLIRTRKEEMLGHSAKMRATFRNADRRSRGEVANGGKWYLAESGKAISTNHEHFQYFSTVLRERGMSDAMPMVVEFITFLMGNAEFIGVIGNDVEAKKAPVKVEVEPEEDDEFCGWATGAAAQPASLGEWGDMGADEPSFSDEEDCM